MASTMRSAPMAAPADELSGIERLLLVVPLLGGAFFGLVPLLFPDLLAAWAGAPGNDHYMYWLAGTATFGYAVALALGVRQPAWAPVRMLVAAVLTFNLASLYTCALEIAGGSARPIVYLICGTSVALVGLCAALLARHRGAADGPPNIAPWLVWLLRVATLLAAIFGLLPLLAPVTFVQLGGGQGTDIFLYRQAGAATLGYATMGLLQLRSRHWAALRLPAVMGLAFNGLACAASLVAIAGGTGGWLAYPVALASLGVALGSALALRRGGQ